MDSSIKEGWHFEEKDILIEDDNQIILLTQTDTSTMRKDARSILMDPSVDCELVFLEVVEVSKGDKKEKRLQMSGSHYLNPQVRKAMSEALKELDQWRQMKKLSTK